MYRMTFVVARLPRLSLAMKRLINRVECILNNVAK
jgi:hypothetical protein